MLLWAGGTFSQTVYPDYVDGKIYVKLKSSYISKSGEAIVPNHQYDLKALPFYQKIDGDFGISAIGKAFAIDAGEKLNNTLKLEFSNYSRVNELIAQLQADPLVEYAEKVPLDKFDLVPNDVRYATQWHLSKINAAAAWNYFSAGSNVVVAIVDDAVQRNHPDIAPNLWINPGEIPADGLDNDGNGYIDDINGWDVAANTNTPDPPGPDFDHGTHVAGISSAATNNSIGVASIGFSCKLMCVKATTSASAITAGYAGVLYAANNGASVINMSWGGNGSSLTNENVMAYAISKGCILVAAAGNDNVVTMHYPAAYPGVIAVASTTTDDSKSSFSNYGPWIKISAPGSSILSTFLNGEYGNLSGTSMASPMVAGLLGLMKSLNPTMPNNALIQCLYNSADPLQGFGGQLGSGRINALKAMECVSATLNNPPVADFTSTNPSVVRGSSVTFTDQSSYSPTSWQWSFPGGTPSSFNGKTPPNIVYNTVGQYTVTLTVTNTFGTNTATRTNYVTVSEPPTCLSPNFPPPANWTLVNYNSGSNALNGFVNGVNSNLDKQKAMFFNLFGTNNTTLTTVAVAFGRAFSTFPDAVVPIRIYDGTSGTPGAQLAVRNLTMAQIMSDVQNARFTAIDFSPSITLPASKAFFVSVDISNLFWDFAFKDSLSILSNVSGQTVGTDIWNQNQDNSWRRYSTPGTWNLNNASLLIHPFVTPNPASVVLNPKNPAVCSGNTFQFNGTGSTYGDILQWQFPGASVPNIVNNVLQPSPFYPNAGSYKVYLLARGGCQELRVDSTIITVNPSPVINISAAKNPICSGESVTLTASGGSNIVWSPPTGLSATTGTVVTANPTTTTTYNVSGTQGVCTANVTYELEVRARNTDISISPSTQNIPGPTSVTFTAVPFNGGSAPTYNFFVNNSSVQNGSSGSLTRTVAPGDQIKCEITSNENCVNEKTVVSNTITMAGSLPVTLVKFSGKKVAQGNLLSWTTASEANSKQFVVERSADANGFIAIGTVAAAGNSNVAKNYNYTDGAPLPRKNYYRLKMLDKDGSFEYSKTILLDADINGTLTSLYPNPSSLGQQVLLQITGGQKGKASVTITNIAGQVVSTLTKASLDGNYQIALPVKQLATGLYIISTKINDEVMPPLKWTVQ